MGGAFGLVKGCLFLVLVSGVWAYLAGNNWLPKDNGVYAFFADSAILEYMEALLSHTIGGPVMSTLKENVHDLFDGWEYDSQLAVLYPHCTDPGVCCAVCSGTSTWWR